MTTQVADPYTVELQLSKDLEKITDTQTRTMVAAWALAWSEVSGDLFDTLKQLLAGGTKITTSTITRSTRLAKTLAAIADQLDTLAADAGVTITRELADVVNQAAAGQNRLIQAQVQRLDDPPRFDPRLLADTRQLTAIVRRSTQQITSQTKPIAPQTFEVVRRELIRGVAAGSNPRETARRMVARSENQFNFGLNRAMVIARTETLDAYREGGRAGQKPHSDVLAGWVWLCHLGPKTCRACLSMHGRLFSLTDAGPEGHQQCKCSRGPVVRTRSGDADLSWVPDADVFFKSLTKAQQVEILGQSGWKAWNAGDFPIGDWAVKKSNPGWRDSWTQTPAPGNGTSGGGGSKPPAAPPAPPTPSPEPVRPSLATMFPGSYDPPDADKARIEAAWTAQMDDTFAGLRAEANTFEYYPDSLYVSGQIYTPGGRVVGEYQREIHDTNGTLWAEHHFLKIADTEQGTGFGQAFNQRLYDWYRASGFERVELDANIDVGGYAWAADGYDFADETGAHDTLTRLTFETVEDGEDEASVQDVLERAQRSLFGSDEYPTAYEMSQAGRRPQHVGRDATWPGKRAMIGLYKTWRGVLWLLR